MAELADAQASGACGSNTVRVQVPLPALSFCPKTGNGKKRPVRVDASYFDYSERMNVQPQEHIFVFPWLFFCGTR